MLRMYETFGNGGANTMNAHVDRRRRRGGARARGGSMTHARVVPAVAAATARWSGRMRNNTNYMETGVLTALD